MERRGKRKTYSSSYSHRYGEFPEAGAIFLSSRATKQECLDRKLFGLPMKNVDFVKAVRTGMTLFLFEIESRKLYGVFEAVSDGQLSINPHAWSSSQKAFPAQVRVRVVWDCDAIPESVLKDVIRDNYYHSNKFRLGLSREQVDTLLPLFIPRTRPEKPLHTKKGRRRQTITSGNSRELFVTQGKPNSEATEHEESDEPPEQEQVKELITIQGKTTTEHEESDEPVLGDYIPLSPVTTCDIDINVKTIYSIKSEQERGGMVPRLDLLPLLDSPETSRDVRRKKSTESALVPPVAHQAEGTTREADCPFYKESTQRHVTESKRVSVFSRLKFS